MLYLPTFFATFNPLESKVYLYETEQSSNGYTQNYAHEYLDDICHCKLFLKRFDNVDYGKTTIRYNYSLSTEPCYSLLPINLKLYSRTSTSIETFPIVLFDSSFLPHLVRGEPTSFTVDISRPLLNEYTRLCVKFSEKLQNGNFSDILMESIRTRYFMESSYSSGSAKEEEALPPIVSDKLAFALADYAIQSKELCPISLEPITYGTITVTSCHCVFQNNPFIKWSGKCPMCRSEFTSKTIELEESK